MGDLSVEDTGGFESSSRFGRVLCSCQPPALGISGRSTVAFPERPYTGTSSLLQGFQVLVESDWLDFGHKFGDRCGHQENAEDQNEQCPVFLQWLDSVHQLLKQFPCLFEFNEAFLVSP